MANGHMPDWEEWSNLKADAQQYKMYEVLTAVTRHLSEQCPARLISCNDRISKLENRKKFDTAASAAGGFLGGLIAMVGKWFIGK